MAGNNKPRKAHKPSWNNGGAKLKTQPWKLRSVFDPLESIIDQLEQEGTINTSDTGTPMFKDETDGHWYCSVSALNGVVEAYEIHEKRFGRNLNLEPLRQLSNKLQYGMLIFDSDTKAVRACLARMRLETMQMTSAYAKELVKDFQIKEALEKIAGTPAQEISQ